LLSVDAQAEAALALYRQLGIERTLGAELLEKRWLPARCAI
jgi:hypothetical protein